MSSINKNQSTDNVLKAQSLSPSWSSHSGKDQYGQFADLQIGDVIQRFRLINSGTFLMGSPQSEAERYDEESHHQVVLSKPFWLADTTVTQALWLAVLGNNPGYFNQNLNNPVEQVSWDDTQTFIQALNKQVSGLNARLPTEAQWEYACRAGTTTPFSFGEQVTNEQVNYDGVLPYGAGEKGVFLGETVAVKSLPVNPWGLYEMHGNLWEWCQDAWSDDLGSEAVTDPEEESGDRRVVRGGSWLGRCGNVRSASRNSRWSDYSYYDFGLRLSVID